jgi:hypothetical protein
VKTVFLGILLDLVGLNIGSSSLGSLSLTVRFLVTTIGGAGYSPLPGRLGALISALLKPLGIESLSLLPCTGSKASLLLSLSVELSRSGSELRRALLPGCRVLISLIFGLLLARIWPVVTP